MNLNLGNPNILAVIIAVTLGAILIPWNIALSKMNIGQYTVILGSVLVILGGGYQLIETGKINFKFSGEYALAWALFACFFYGLAILLISVAFSHPQGTASIIGAIIAGYPFATIATEAIVKRQWPSFVIFLFASLIVAGVAGLSIFGSKQT